MGDIDEVQDMNGTQQSKNHNRNPARSSDTYISINDRGQRSEGDLGGNSDEWRQILRGRVHVLETEQSN